MENLLALYTPAEAWDELLDRRRAYFDRYLAAYSGNHEDLAQTAFPGSFWKRGGKVKMHVPVAADIASTSANLLFGEEPRFSIYDESLGDTEEGSQPRLDAILSANNMNQKLHEAAELASASGDVFLKCRYDKMNADTPVIVIVSGQDALPEYRLGKLQCIHFFSLLKIERKTGKVWRVYERYEPGHIYTGVYQGDSSTLGIEEPAVLNGLGLEPEAIPPVSMILAAHIVNIRPSRVWPTADKGRSDFEGLRDLTDSLDEIYTSWMRDIRLAKSRLIVPAEFLRRNPSDMFSNNRFTYDFDEDVETLVALDIGGDNAEMKITPSQFNIRSQEHADAYERTLRTIISMAGYSPQTFGLDIEGNAQSGTARRIMEKKSLANNAKKQSYWIQPLQDFLTAVLQLDRALYGNAALHDDDVVRVELHDPIVTDIMEIASTVQVLHNAQAASTEIMLKLLHPDWTQSKIDEEKNAIYTEYGVEVPGPDLLNGEGERQ